MWEKKTYNNLIFSYNYNYNKNFTNVISIKLELDRQTSLSLIFNKYYSNLLNYINTDEASYISINKDKLWTIFVRFILHSLSNETKDPLIPSTNIDFMELYHSYEHELNIKDYLDSNKINKLHDDLRKSLQDASKKILTTSYNNINNDIPKDNVNSINDTGKSDRWNVNIAVSNKTVSYRCVYNNTSLKQFTISKYLYDHINNAWNMNKSKFPNITSDKLRFVVYLLLLRYDYLFNLKTYQSATHLSIFKHLSSELMTNNSGFELYSSILNNYYHYYCSIFYDLEKYFGSFGTSECIQPISGLFTIGAFPTISMISRITSRDWFKFVDIVPHSDCKKTNNNNNTDDKNNDNNNNNDNITQISQIDSVYIYIKLQGGWGLENRIQRFKQNDYLMNFYRKNIDSNLTGLEENIKQNKKEHYGDDDPIDTYLDLLTKSSYLKMHKLINKDKYKWIDYINGKTYHNNDVAIYLLSNHNLDSDKSISIFNFNKIKYEDIGFYNINPRYNTHRLPEEAMIEWLKSKYKINTQ
jgi:hypothetical protein